LNVSIIIPSNQDSADLEEVLSSLSIQTLRPKKVIIVDSSLSGYKSTIWVKWRDRFKVLSIDFLVFHSTEILYPGAARNEGLKFTNEEWVGFLDVRTIPCPEWLASQLKQLKEQESDGIFGVTFYVATNQKSAAVRDAIYGRRPIRTLPGSVLKKDLFNLVGQFIPNIRAAEDTEWMIRAKAMGVNIADSSHEALISYIGLTKLGLRGLAKKWRRNYLSARQLQHLKVQTTIVWLVGYFMVSLIAFNWNAIVAGWQVESPFYIDHVTKIVSLTPIALYIVFRGCYLPLKRGVPFTDIFPFRFLLLAAVGALLDTVKVATIFFPRER